MPPKQQQVQERSLAQVAADVGLYPLDAYEFVQQGLSFTVHRIHGGDANAKPGDEPNPNHHVSGQQLCAGLREFALAQWGLLARSVLRRWNITCTLDFGRIVFALIDASQMRKDERDSMHDFDAVFDFRSAFGPSEYRIAVDTLGG